MSLLSLKTKPLVVGESSAFFPMKHVCEAGHETKQHQREEKNSVREMSKRNLFTLDSYVPLWLVYAWGKWWGWIEGEGGGHTWFQSLNHDAAKVARDWKNGHMQSLFKCFKLFNKLPLKSLTQSWLNIRAIQPRSELCTSSFLVRRLRVEKLCNELYQMKRLLLIVILNELVMNTIHSILFCNYVGLRQC